MAKGMAGPRRRTARVSRGSQSRPSKERRVKPALRRATIPARLQRLMRLKAGAPPGPR